MEHSSFKAITLLIKKASYCISICLYMLNPKLIAFPSKERSDPDWGLPSQSLRAVHCEAGQTHPPTPTDTNANLSPPTTTIGNWNTHTFWLISGQIGQTVKTFVEVLASVHLSLLLLTFSIMSSCWSWSFFLLYEKIIVNCRENSFICYNTALEQPQGAQFGPLTGVLIPQLN